MSDWFHHRDEEIARAVQAYEEAISAADAAHAIEVAVQAAAEEDLRAGSLLGPEGVLRPEGVPQADQVTDVGSGTGRDADAGRPAGVEAMDEVDVLGGSARGPRPDMGEKRSITGYRRDELVAIVRWIESDTLLRTEEELTAEVMRELGFGRKGSRITATITAAIREARSDPA